MIVQEPVQAAIWHCLNHYSYKDAIFLAERLYAEVSSDESLFLLATCYYRSGRPGRAYSILQNKGCKTAQCKYLLARCCLDLNKLSEAEAALSGSNASKVQSSEDVVSEFGDSACFAEQIIGRVCSRSERLQRAAEAHKHSLKLNPFLWSSYEALCNLGEKPDPCKIFQLSSLESLNTCQGTNPLVQLVNTQGGGPGDKPASSHIIDNLNENQGCTVVNSTPIHNSTSSPLLPITPIPMIQEDTPVNENVKVPFNLPARLLNKTSKSMFGGVLSLSPLTPSFGVLPLDNLQGSDYSYNPAMYITPSPPVYMESESIVPKVVAKKQPITRKTHALNPTPRPTVFSQSGNTSNTMGCPTSTVQPTSLQANNLANVRRSSRLFSSSNSVKENNKSPTKNKFTSKMPTRKTKTRTTKTGINDLNEANKPEISCVESKKDSGVSVAVRAATIQKAAAEGLMSLLQDLGKAYLYLTQYNCNQTIEVLSAIPSQHYSTGWVLCTLGRAYFELADYNQAVQRFEEVRQLEPHRLEGMEYYSTALWHLQKEVSLSALAQEMVEVEQDGPEAWCAAGNCFSLQKEHDTAIKFFQRAVQLDSNFPYAYTLLGHEYVATEELDKAISCFRSAIRLDSRHYNAWYGVGMIYYKQEKFQLAEIHFRKALAINPQSSVLMCHVAVVQYALQKADQALATLSKALTTDPRNPLCKFHRASIYSKTDRHQEALKELEELKEIVPKESLVYFLTGKVQKKLGNTHLALMNFSWAMDLDPKGANNQIKEAIDKRYANDDDEPLPGNDTLTEEFATPASTATTTTPSNNTNGAGLVEPESSQASSAMDAEDINVVAIAAMESDESI